MRFSKSDKEASSTQAVFTAMQMSQEIFSLENKTISHLHSCLGRKKRLWKQDMVSDQNPSVSCKIQPQNKYQNKGLNFWKP